jgi:hypothetical protein
MLSKFAFKKLSIFLVIIILFNLISCGGGGGGADGSVPLGNIDDKFVLFINKSQGDPLLCEIRDENSSEAILYYGIKNDNGYPIAIEALQIYVSEESLPYTIYYNGQLLPIRITGPEGEVADISYDNETIIINLVDEFGNHFIEAISFPSGIVDFLNQVQDTISSTNKQSSNDKLETDHLIQSENKKSIIYRGRSIFYLRAGNIESGVSGAILKAYASDQKSVIPVLPDGNNYKFTVIHQVKDEQYDIDECEDYRTQNSLLLGAAGIGIFAIVAICGSLGFASAAICQIFGGKFGMFAGGVLGAGGFIETVKGTECKDNVIKAYVEAGKGRRNVTVHGFHPGANVSAQDGVEYDVYNPNDPYYASKSYDIPLEAEIVEEIISIQIDPPIPEQNNEYDLYVKAIALAPVTLKYKIVTAHDDLIEDGEVILSQYGENNVKINVQGYSHNEEFHFITLTLQDGESNLSERTTIVRFKMNISYPSVRILEPSDKSVYEEGDTINAKCTASDEEDGDINGDSIRWGTFTSDILHTGSTVVLNGLPPGEHVIYCTATDSGGLSSIDTVNITINKKTEVIPIDLSAFNYGRVQIKVLVDLNENGEDIPNQFRNYIGHDRGDKGAFSGSKYSSTWDWSDQHDVHHKGHLNILLRYDSNDSKVKLAAFDYSSTEEEKAVNYFYTYGFTYKEGDGCKEITARDPKSDRLYFALNDNSNCKCIKDFYYKDKAEGGETTAVLSEQQSVCNISVEIEAVQK